MPHYPSTNQATEYSFRPNLFIRQRLLKLLDNAIEITEGNKAPRRVPLAKITRLVENTNTAADPEQGHFGERSCTLCIQEGRNVTLSSASWLSPNDKVTTLAKKQDHDYQVFLTELKRRLLEINPGIRCDTGSYLLALAWCICLIIGLCLMMGIFATLWFYPESFWDDFVAMLTLFLIGLPLSFVSIKIAWEAWPRKHQLANQAGPQRLSTASGVGSID